MASHGFSCNFLSSTWISLLSIRACTSECGLLHMSTTYTNSLMRAQGVLIKKCNITFDTEEVQHMVRLYFLRITSIVTLFLRGKQLTHVAELAAQVSKANVAMHFVYIV